MHRGADSAKALREKPGVPRIAAPKNPFDPSPHGARSPCIADRVVLHLDIHADSAQFHPGFIDHPVLVTIPGGPSFDPDPPTTPRALVVVPTVLLPADPTNVRGRVVEAHNPETPISGATLELLQGGPPISAVTTDADGRYRFNDVTVLAPSQIRCSKAGFKTEARPLLVDFGKLINEEYFRLAPP